MFDKVDDNIVLHKIKALNMKGKILKWLETFLKEATELNGHLSDWVWVFSGFLKGSVRGLLLFLILMIDIDRNIENANLGSFADDTKI